MARFPIFMGRSATLLALSSLISVDFWDFLSFLSDRSVFVPSDKCAENTAIAVKIKRKPKNHH